MSGDNTLIQKYGQADNRTAGTVRGAGYRFSDESGKIKMKKSHKHVLKPGASRASSRFTVLNLLVYYLVIKGLLRFIIIIIEFTGSLG